MNTYRVLTVKQPYAGLIVLGLKTLETRSWNTKYRGELVIHASAKPDKVTLDKYMYDLTTPALVPDAILTNGAFIGIVNLADCFPQSELLDRYGHVNLKTRIYSHWDIDNHFAWALENPRIVNFTPAKGKLGIWKWEGEL